MSNLINLEALPIQNGRPSVSGRIVGLRGPLLYAKLPIASHGDICTIKRRDLPPLIARIVAFNEETVSLVPFDEPFGVGPGSLVEHQSCALRVQVESDPRGRVVNALGESIQGSPQGERSLRLPIERDPPSPLSRKPVDKIFLTGVRAIDAVCTLGYGQRVGLFAGPGVGKSTLLGMIARNASADIVVIGLIGERGREVNDFLNDSLGAEGLSRSVIVVATSDEPPIRRSLAPLTATAIAEHYRSQGKNVLLLLDSLTRTARAVRDVSLAAGELPVRQGYTPTVYSTLPKILERAGNDHLGSITAIYTVLTNAENDSDPLAEEVKSLLDGHLVLTHELAQRGVRPALDLTLSLSRLVQQLRTPEDQKTIQGAVAILARIKRDRDLLLLGGKPDAELAAALKVEPELTKLRTQGTHERSDYAQTVKSLREIVQRAKSIPKI